MYFSEARKKNKKKTSKNRSIPEDLGIYVSLESLLNTFVFYVLVNFEVITGTSLLGTYGIYVLQYLQRPLVNNSQILTEAVNGLWLEGFNRGWKDREGTGWEERRGGNGVLTETDSCGTFLYRYIVVFFLLVLFSFLDVTGGEEVDESVEEETRLNRSIGISKEKIKKKKKIRKVMSWNF